MKLKRIVVTTAALTLVAGASTGYAAELKGTTSESVKYTNNGQAVSPAVPAVNIDGSLYLPLRAFSEAAGKYVDWDEFRGIAALTDKPMLTGKYKLNAPDLAKGIKMGVGSSLTHLPNDPADVFYSTADRGPNFDITTVSGVSAKSFPLPSYNPSIYKIQIADGQIKILDQFPLKVNGTDSYTGTSNISGLPNIKGRDEAAFYDTKGEKETDYDAYGLDIEGLAYNSKDDTFWISDEYGPSIVHVKRDGTIIERIVPKGWAALKQSPLVPAREVLPEVYNKLRSNRGAEAVGITPDGKYMFIAMQSALRNPNKDTDPSRQLRIIKIDLATLQPVAEFAYVTEEATQFKNVKQADVVISDLVAVSENTLLIDERDKFSGADAQLKRIFAINLSDATNILGKYDDNKATGKTLEQMSTKELKDAGIMPPSKRTVLDSIQFKFPFEKIEGLSLINGDTIAIINDNDFGVTNPDSSENGTEMWTFKLPYTIK